MRLKDPQNYVGNKIKSLRQKEHWSQGNVAKQLNLSIPAFCKIESGIVDINMSRAVEIAKIFDISVCELISDMKETTPAKDFPTQVKELEIAIDQKNQELILLQKKAIKLFEELRERNPPAADTV